MLEDEADDIFCPFCQFKSRKSEEVQLHIWSTHEERLKTPTKNSSSAKQASADCNGDYANETCPLCNEVFSLQYVEEHLLKHSLSASRFNGDAPCSSNSALMESQTAATDAMIAKQVEMEEQKRLQDEMLSKAKAEELHLKMLQEEQNMNPGDKMTFAQQATKFMERAVGQMKMTTTEFFQKKFEMFEKLEEGLDDQSTVTADLSGQIANILPKHSPQIRWLLCSRIVHCGRGAGDSGWGCAYRNLQMMISNLTQLPRYEEVVQNFKDRLPSIPRLQEMIEYAWSCGFDQRGREQLGGALSNTRKWIGATEAFVLLSSLGLHCKIIDFEGTRVRRKTAQALFAWISDYFFKNHQGMGGYVGVFSADPVTILDIPILYLQYQGHSVSISGLKYDSKNKVVSHLMVLDPSLTKERVHSALGRSAGRVPTFFKPLSWFDEDKYQVVAVVGVASPDRFERQKSVETLAEKHYAR